MIAAMLKPPQVDYGQKSGAFNPGTRSPVYQQVERARGDLDFASLFAADIMFGKKESGEHFYAYATVKDKDEQGNPVLRQELRKYNMSGGGYLHNKNSLNASRSWVPQAFGAPVVRGDDGEWYKASILLNNKAGNGASQWGFIQESKLNDANVIRLLNEGHYAFKAPGAGGREVYVPWVGGFEPAKGEGGVPEAGNRKKEENTNPSRARNMIGIGAAQPGNIMGGSQARSMLGPVGQQNRTLLGGA